MDDIVSTKYAVLEILFDTKRPNKKSYGKLTRQTLIRRLYGKYSIDITSATLSLHLKDLRLRGLVSSFPQNAPLKRGKHGCFLPHGWKISLYGVLRYQNTKSFYQKARC